MKIFSSKTAKQIFSILITFVLLFGTTPIDSHFCITDGHDHDHDHDAHVEETDSSLSDFLSFFRFDGLVVIAHADYEDGMECPECGGYHWDDWLACDDCGMCIDCAADYTCPYCEECTYCAGYRCGNCGLCSDCAIICSGCGDACSDCSYICEDCNQCIDCVNLCAGCNALCEDCAPEDAGWCENCGLCGNCVITWYNGDG